MAELVDALDSKSCAFGRAGSIPARGTKNQSECESESGNTNSDFFLHSHSLSRANLFSMISWKESCESESGNTNSDFFLHSHSLSRADNLFSMISWKESCWSESGNGLYFCLRSVSHSLFFSVSLFPR